MPHPHGELEAQEAERPGLRALRPKVMEPCHFIFHVGHCGSTLLLKLLGQLPGVVVFREPRALMELADAYSMADRPDALLSREQVGESLKHFYQLLISPPLVPIVKPTSICGCLGPQLLSFNDNNKALLLSVEREPYLATMLRNEDNLLDARRLAPTRMRLLLQHVDAPELRLHQLSAGELVALGWLAGVADLNAIHAHFEARAMRLDFDAFLDQPALWMARVCEHFGLPSDDATIRELLGSKAFTHHSKRPGQPFSAQDRLELLQASRKQNSAEITAGMDFVASCY